MNIVEQEEFLFMWPRYKLRSRAMHGADSLDCQFSKLNSNYTRHEYWRSFCGLSKCRFNTISLVDESPDPGEPSPLFRKIGQDAAFTVETFCSSPRHLTSPHVCFMHRVPC